MKHDGKTYEEINSVTFALREARAAFNWRSYLERLDIALAWWLS